jgi:hypothetical protein
VGDARAIQPLVRALRSYRPARLQPRYFAISVAVCFVFLGLSFVMNNNAFAFGAFASGVPFFITMFHTHQQTRFCRAAAQALQTIAERTPPARELHPVIQDLEAIADDGIHQGPKMRRAFRRAATQLKAQALPPVSATLPVVDTDDTATDTLPRPVDSPAFSEETLPRVSAPAGETVPSPEKGGDSYL